jgi:GTP-binding protein HflX
MPFATLDPTARLVRAADHRPFILSDTVGFITDLPHELVEAFRATLEEVQSADLVLHVRDIADPDSVAQARDVEAVLDRMGMEEDREHRLIEVWNKIDLMPPEDRAVLEARAARSAETGVLAVPVSAVTGEGCDVLLREIASRIDQGPPIDAVLGPQDGDAIAWLYRNGRVLERSELEDGQIRLRVRLEPQALGRFERLYPNALAEFGVGPAV